MSKIVKLNVGGKQFQTTETTLKNFGDSMLALMIQQPNEMEMIKRGQELFIDRDGEYFAYVIDYMRNGDQMFIPQDNTVRMRLITETIFYQLPGLARLIKKAGAFKVGDIVQLRDSDAARTYFESVINREATYAGIPSYLQDEVEPHCNYLCWICSGPCELPGSLPYFHKECRNSNQPIKYDIFVGKVAAIDGQCAMVTVTKGCMASVFSKVMATEYDLSFNFHIPLAYLKLSTH